jgi:hypothetical protein
MPENKNNNKEEEKIQKSEAQESKSQKVDFSSLSQTHGKTEEFRPTTLEQIWGDTGTWKYNTMDETEYRGVLENMPKSDLLAHATKIGLIPVDDRTMLINRLTSEFKKHVIAYRSPMVDGSKSKPLSKEAEKILKEGR